MTQEKTQTDLYIRQLSFWPHLSTPEKLISQASADGSWWIRAMVAFI